MSPYNEKPKTIALLSSIALTPAPSQTPPSLTPPRHSFEQQETQDRTRRVKIFEANRAKDRDQRHRLSQPNEDPAKPQATIPRSQRRKRSRSKRPAPSRPDNRDALYYSSDEGRRQAKVGGGEEEEDVGVDAEEASGGFDAGLASYKKLLSALEGGSSSVFAAGGGDKDLAAAVVARRLQREGRDEGDSSNDSDSGSSDAEDEDEDGEDDDEDDEGDADYDEDAEEQGDDNQQGTTKNASREGPKAMDEESDGPDSTTSETHGSSSGTEDGFDATDADTVAAVEDFGTDKDDDLLLARTGKNAHVKTSDGRGRDDFSRHFVSTPVFPPDQAAGLLSPSGRPSFKPLSGAAQGKWKAMGLSASASRGADVPPGLSAGASLSQELGVLPSLADGWDACNDGPASKLQSLILPPLTGYRDMLYCGWRDEDADTIRRSYALHALNHALTSQRRVVRHTARLRKASEETRVAAALARASAGTGGATAEQEKKVPGNGNGHGGQGPQEGKPPLAKGGRGGDASKKALDGNASSMGKTTVHSESDDWQRDQGFTRPKVLILLPFRGLAHELVEIMIGLLGTKTVVINKHRFDEEYGPDEEDNSDEASEDGEGGGAGDARAERAKAVLERKPGDWKALFGGGRNVDDMFTLGLSLSPGGGKGKPGEGKGVGVRLYCDFYNSDIVIASPVALHRACVPGGDGGGEGSGVDSDFLSSVEICIMDRADVFLMQNWAYVPELAAVLNSRPTGERASRADFSRVRPLFLHEQGRLFRQTLVFSAYQVRWRWSCWFASRCAMDGLLSISYDGRLLLR